MEYQEILARLLAANVRFVLVGGYAVVLHGVPRFTRDLDLLLDLDDDNVKRLIAALEALGFQPRAPVPASQLTDEQMQHQWMADKGLKAFSFWHPREAHLVVDILLVSPVSFSDVWHQAKLATWGDYSARIASISHLIVMKEAAGRKQDLGDVAALRQILDLQEREGDDAPS